MKPVMLLLDKSEKQKDLCHVNGFPSQASEDADALNGDSMSQTANCNLQDDLDEEEQTGNDEVDAGADEDNFDNQSDFDDLDDEFNKSLDDIEDDENDFNNLKESEQGDKTKSAITAAQLNAYMQQLQNLIPGMNTSSSSNVLLEPMEATKAAVAQFAENNPEEEKDVGKLHAALFNLQQQQIMQLQLIHQLQQQLVAGGVQNGQQLHAALLNSHLGGNFPGMGLNLPAFSGLRKPDPPMATPSHLSSHSPKSGSPTGIHQTQEEMSRSSSPSPSDRSTPDSSTLSKPASTTAGKPASEPSSAGLTSPSSLLMTTSKKEGQVPIATSSPSSSGIIDYSGAGTKG